jgi:hypothetical protein
MQQSANPLYLFSFCYRCAPLVCDYARDRFVDVTFFSLIEWLSALLQTDYRLLRINLISSALCSSTMITANRTFNANFNFPLFLF